MRDTCHDRPLARSLLPFLTLLGLCGVTIRPLAYGEPAQGAQAFPPSSPTTLPAAPDELIRRWTAELGDDDPKIRQQAEDQLVRAGSRHMQVARVLQQGAASDDPELASRARTVLARLRWEDPDDPNPVRDLTVGMAGKPMADRCERIDRLAELPADAGVHALFRIVRRDRSSSVQWYVVARLRQGAPPFDEPALAELESPDTSPAAVALAAWVWESHDYGRAGKLFQRALDSAPMPVKQAPPGQAAEDSIAVVPDFVFDSLIRCHTWANEHEQAIQTLRRQIDQAVIVSGIAPPQKIDELFAMHGSYGPLPGIASDFARASGLLQRPQVIYGLNRLCLRMGCNELAEYARNLAFTESGNDQWGRAAIADFLTAQNWDDLANAESRQILALGDGVGNTNACDAHFILAMSAMRRGDHAAAYQHYKDGLDRGRTLQLNVEYEGKVLDDSQTRRRTKLLMQGHGMMAVRDSGDKDAQLERATALVHLMLDDPPGPASLPLGIDDTNSFTIAAVPALKAAGMDQSAAALFKLAYDLDAQSLQKDPANPFWMNYLAWLCTSCGDHLDEARALAEKAVAAEPQNGYYLDTLADCLFHFGDYDQAIRLEKLAAASNNPPPEFQKQLTRFEAARAAHSSPATSPAGAR